MASSSTTTTTNNTATAAAVAGDLRPETPNLANTVFADPDNFTVKHPLAQPWCLWFDNPQKKASKETWSEQLKNLSTFQNVEDFWAVFNNIRPASSLDNGSNYHLFKAGVRPEWEDKANENGGKWVLQFKPMQKRELDKAWLYLILALIGEIFDTSDICGCVVSVRPAVSRIALWVKDGDNMNSYKPLGEKLKALLELGDRSLEFSSHQASMKPRGKSGTFIL